MKEKLKEIKEFWKENKTYILIILVCLFLMGILGISLRHEKILQYQKEHPIVKTFDISDGVQVGLLTKDHSLDIMYYKNEDAIGIANVFDNTVRVIIKMDSVEQFRKDIEIAFNTFQKWKYQIDTMGITEINKEICVFPTHGIIFKNTYWKNDPISFRIVKDIFYNDDKTVKVVKTFSIQTNDCFLITFWETDVTYPNKKVVRENTQGFLKEMLKVLDVNYIKNCKNKVLFNYQRVEMFDKIAS